MEYPFDDINTHIGTVENPLSQELLSLMEKYCLIKEDSINDRGNKVISFSVNVEGENLLLADIEYNIDDNNVHIIHTTTMNWKGADLLMSNGKPWGFKEDCYSYTREVLGREHIIGLGYLIVQTLEMREGKNRLYKTQCDNIAIGFYKKYVERSKAHYNISGLGSWKTIQWNYNSLTT